MPVTVEREGPVTTVILDEPAVRNAVDRATAEALADAFRAFEDDDDASVAVLWGAGGTFCAGANLKAVATGDGNRVAPDGDGPMGPSRMLLSKPVVAAIAGHAVAGGLELALWCDLRVVEEDAVLGVFCRRWGVPLIGRPVSAKEALAIGLATLVVPPGDSRAAAEALARELARFPQLCMRHDRLSAYEQHDLPLQEALGNELRHGLVALEHEALGGAARFAAGAGRGGVAAPLDDGAAAALGDATPAPHQGGAAAEASADRANAPAR
jgi:enoyl-CoA hydratase